MTKADPKMKICHIQEFCWNTFENNLHPDLVFGFALKADTTWGALSEINMENY
jgi:hypothetical protein